MIHPDILASTMSDFSDGSYIVQGIRTHTILIAATYPTGLGIDVPKVLGIGESHHQDSHIWR